VCLNGVAPPSLNKIASTLVHESLYKPVLWSSESASTEGRPTRQPRSAAAVGYIHRGLNTGKSIKLL